MQGLKELGAFGIQVPEEYGMLSLPSVAISGILSYSAELNINMMAHFWNRISVEMLPENKKNVERNFLQQFLHSSLLDVHVLNPLSSCLECLILLNCI